MLDIKVYMVRWEHIIRMPRSTTPAPRIYLKEGGVNINYLPKRGWKYGAGAGLLKGGRGLTLLLFNFFKVYHFYILKLFYSYFTKFLCYTFEKKNFFLSANIILSKKSHSKLSKNEPVCICNEDWCWIRAGGGVLCGRVGGIVWNTLKGCGIEKKGEWNNFSLIFIYNCSYHPIFILHIGLRSCCHYLIFCKKLFAQLLSDYFGFSIWLHSIEKSLLKS